MYRVHEDFISTVVDNLSRFLYLIRIDVAELVPYVNSASFELNLLFQIRAVRVLA